MRIEYVCSGAGKPENPVGLTAFRGWDTIVSVAENECRGCGKYFRLFNGHFPDHLRTEALAIR